MNNDSRREFECLERAFYAALDLPDGSARATFIADVCTTDPQTGEELRELLENHRLVREAAPGKPAPLPRFGAWQAVRSLGTGGMGTVYLAERADGAFEMMAAVKVAPLALAAPEIEQRFLSERQLLARLNHPGITRLLDGGVSFGLPYFVMEFIEGETIDRYATRRALGTRERLALLRQMLEALDYVHSQQVLHGDLKTSNVLVDASGRVKLCDFGVALLMASGADGSKPFALTPHYASPEQLRGGPVTVRSDIYSAGLLMRKLLTDGGGEIDRSLDAIVRKATAQNPADRFASAEAMNAALARCAEGRTSVRSRHMVFVLAALITLAVGIVRWRSMHVETPSRALSSSAQLPAGASSKIYIPKPDAEALVIQGQAALKLVTPDSARNAEALFRRAIDIDPGYALPYALLATTIWDRSGHGVRARAEEERKELLRLGRKAEELDPDAAKPHIVLAVQAMQYDWDWEEAERELKLAVSARDADASAFTNYALLLTFRGRGGEAEIWIDRALRLDPHGYTALSNAVTYHYLRGETAQQIEAAKSLLRAYPNDLMAQLQNALANVLDKHPELAWPVFRSSAEHSVNAAVVEAVTRALIGDRDEALRLIRPLEQQYTNGEVALQGLAQVYGWLNDEANAVKWLDRSADAREWQLLNVAVNPAFRNMQDTPGFHALKRRMRLE